MNIRDERKKLDEALERERCLRQQLAAEQQQRRILAGNIEQEVERRTKELSQQLAAAVEALEQLGIQTVEPRSAVVANAALAKLGEGK